MNKPKMILFDYGQTLIDEMDFDAVRGTEAVLKYATKNKYNLSADQVQDEAVKLFQETGRFAPDMLTEIPNHMFNSYLYESLGIQLSIDAEEIDRVFWKTASPGKPTNGIQDFLEFLHRNGIRTGVISNIGFCGKVLVERMNRHIPKNHFEFIVATSEYMFRKPNKRIFNLALEKAELKAEDVWYIGDHYIYDIVGARNAGIMPIWYKAAMYAPDEQIDDCLTIMSWDELKNIIQKSL